jgi:hypothetical protein
MKIGDTHVNFDLDTGSSVTIINEETYKSKLKDKFPLKATKVKLKAYSGDAIPVLGECTVPVQYDR